MTRCNSCNGIITKTDVECYVCGDPVPGAARPKKLNRPNGWFLLAALVPLLLASPSKAFGYADPGTGAFVYQAAYAAFLGASFYLRKLLDRLWRSRKIEREDVATIYLPR